MNALGTNRVRRFEAGKPLSMPRMRRAQAQVMRGIAWQRALRDRGIWRRAVLIGTATLVISGAFSSALALPAGALTTLACVVAQGWLCAETRERTDRAGMN